MEDDANRAQYWLSALTDLEGELDMERRADVRRRQAAFLAAYEASFNKVKAARAAGIGRQQSYAWQHEDQVFREAFLSAQEAVREEVAEEIKRRALEGVETPVRNRQGDVVGVDRKVSDRLLVHLSRSIDPDRFGDARQAPVEEKDSWRRVMAVVMVDPVALAALDELADRMFGAAPERLPKVIPGRAGELPPASSPSVRPWPADAMGIGQELRDLGGQQPLS